MAIFIHQPMIIFLILGTFLQCSCFAKKSDSKFILGVNYGQEMNKVPNAGDIPPFLKQTAITSVRFLGVDSLTIKELGDTNISIALSMGNGDIVGLGEDSSVAKHWVKEAIGFAYPKSKIVTVTVGNEVITTESQQKMKMLVPAMKNIQKAIKNAKYKNIKVSTIFSMSILATSDPPSSAAFEPKYLAQVKDVVKFLKSYKAPFMIDLWPYFAYENDPTPELLKYCLFEDTVGKVDPGNNYKYMNMFDAMVDAVRTALNKIGACDVPIVVSATGWPSRGDSHEKGATMKNAKAYNKHLVRHLMSVRGTPLNPKVPINTYISSLFNEDAKHGPTISTSSYGLFNATDFSPLYNAGIVPAGKINKPAPAADPMADSANWFNLKSGPPDGVVV